MSLGGLDTATFTKAIEVYTGSRTNFNNLSKAQKELFLARVHAMPKFNNKTLFPDFRPREYTAQDIADFVASVGKSEFTANEVETFLRDRFEGKTPRNYQE